MNQYLVFGIYALIFGVIMQPIFLKDNPYNLTLRGKRFQFIVLCAVGYLFIYLADRAW